MKVRKLKRDKTQDIMVHKRVRLLYFRIQIIKIKRGLNNGIMLLEKMLTQVASMIRKISIC